MMGRGEMGGGHPAKMRAVEKLATRRKHVSALRDFNAKNVKVAGPA